MSAEKLERALDLDEDAQLLVDGLAPDEADRLWHTIEAARRAHHDDIDRFCESVVAGFPRPLRGRARRLLGVGT